MQPPSRCHSRCEEAPWPCRWDLSNYRRSLPWAPSRRRRSNRRTRGPERPKSCPERPRCRFPGREQKCSAQGYCSAPGYYWSHCCSSRCPDGFPRGGRCIAGRRRNRPRWPATSPGRASRAAREQSGKRRYVVFGARREYGKGRLTPAPGQPEFTKRQHDGLAQGGGGRPKPQPTGPRWSWSRRRSCRR